MSWRHKMSSFTMADFAPEEEQLDVSDEATYQALLAESQAGQAVVEEPPLEGDDVIIDALLQQQQQRMQATLTYQRQAEEANRQARMMHERMWRSAGG
jgi:hypothetical protein